ncbi:MAG: HEAT repeat domain-containing protein [Bacteroidota bacterium]
MIRTTIQSEILTSYGGLVSVALVLMLGCLALVLVLYIHRALAMARKKKVDDLQFRYQYLLYDALVESQSENASDNFLETVLQLFQQEKKRSGSLNQQVLTDIILNLKKSLTGAAQDQLLELAYALGLPEYAQKKLRQQSFNIRTQGLHEVTAMQINSTEIRNEIEVLQQVDTSPINQEVILALTKLESAPNLGFLNKLTTPLSEWLQIRLHHHLRSLERHQLPDFSQWLDSTNESVVLFALRMTAEFKQYAASQKVLNQLNGSLVPILIETIKTVTKLKLEEAIPSLTNLIQHENTDVQLASLEAVGELGNSQQLATLSSLHEHPNYWVRRATATAVTQLESNTPVS